MPTRLLAAVAALVLVVPAGRAAEVVSHTLDNGM